LRIKMKFILLRSQGYKQIFFSQEIPEMTEKLEKERVFKIFLN